MASGCLAQNQRTHCDGPSATCTVSFQFSSSGGLADHMSRAGTNSTASLSIPKLHHITSAREFELHSLAKVHVLHNRTYHMQWLHTILPIDTTRNCHVKRHPWIVHCTVLGAILLLYPKRCMTNTRPEVATPSGYVQQWMS